MLIIIIVFLAVLSVSILVHEIGHFLLAKRAGVKVEEFGIGMFIKLWSFKKGETEYSINAIPIGGFVKLQGEDEEIDSPRSFSAKSPLAKISILSAGVVSNFILAFILFWICFLFGMPVWGGQVKIEEIAPNSPAQKSELQSGDAILKIQGVEISSTGELSQETEKYLGQEVVLEIKRGEEDFTKTIVPRKNPPEDEGPMGVKIVAEPVIAEREKYSFFNAAFEALKTTYEITKLIVFGIFYMIRDLFVSRVVPTAVAGPVGIGQIIGRLVAFGLIPVIQFAGILNINLGLVNFLPFPALDGGRVVFIIAEALTRKKIPAHIERWIHAIGLMILLLILLFFTYRDILRLF